MIAEERFKEVMEAPCPEELKPIEIFVKLFTLACEDREDKKLQVN